MNKWNENALVAHVQRKLDWYIPNAVRRPSDVHLQKVKEYMLKKYADNQKENAYWLNNLNDYFYYNMDMTQEYTDIVNSITAKDIQKFAADLLKQGNEIEVTMTVPKK